MTITKKQDGTNFEFILAGRLDTATAPMLKEELGQIPGDIEKLTFDFSDLEYISSAGLRIMLLAKRTVKTGKVTIKNANDLVKEVFEVTDFTNLFDFE